MLASCASSSSSKTHYKSLGGVSAKHLGLKKLSPSEVIIKKIPAHAFAPNGSTMKWQQSLQKKGLTQFGMSKYKQEGQPNLNEIRTHAASIGARVVYVDIRGLGRGRKTIAEPIAHTRGRTITSSSNTSGTINISSNSYGSIGSTSYYGNTYGTGTYSGRTNSSTYIPGSTIYGSRQVSYSVTGIMAIFCAPQSDISADGIRRLQQYETNFNRY